MQLMAHNDLATSERDRVAQHIARAEHAAHRRDTRDLDPLRRLVRALLLEELAHYRAEGRFPLNRDFDTLTPYFVDADGTRCAMAHLLEAGGEATLVGRIAHARNNARVRELADEPRLLAWLAAAGITVEEAAAIQPSYCMQNSSCVCGGDFFRPYSLPASGVLEARVTGPANTMGFTPAQIERIYGDAGGRIVGEIVDVGNLGSAVVGRLALVPVQPPSDAGSTSPLSGLLLTEAATVECGGAAAPNLTLGADTIANAFQASSCNDYLAALDANWTCVHCDDFPNANTPIANCHDVPDGSMATADASAFGDVATTADIANTVDTGGTATMARGCAVGPATDAPTTLGILLALVATMAQRRRRS